MAREHSFHSGPSSPGAELLSVTVVREPEWVTHVVAVGEIDLTSTPLFERVLETEPAPGVRAVVVDLGEVSYCSSGGLLALSRLRDRAGTAAVELVVNTLTVRRVLEVSGLATIFPTHRSYADALEALAERDG